MKKQIFTFLLIFCVGLALGFMSPVTAEAASVKLTYSNFFPPGHIQSKLAESWCKEVEMRTNGQVVVEYFPGQTLTKARQVYDGVVEGISDVGFSVLAYTRGRFPVMSAVDLPLGYTSGTVATKVVTRVASIGAISGISRKPILGMVSIIVGSWAESPNALRISTMRWVNASSVTSQLGQTSSNISWRVTTSPLARARQHNTDMAFGASRNSLSPHSMQSRFGRTIQSPTRKSESTFM